MEKKSQTFAHPRIRCEIDLRNNEEPSIDMVKSEGDLR
jgi:hypothetical protein